MRIAPLLFLATLPLAAQRYEQRQEPKPQPPPPRPAPQRHPHDCRCARCARCVPPARPEEDEARSVAEGATGGKAVQLRRIDLNGATGGWEVRVRMENRAKGWRLIIDRDTWRIRDRYEIPNP